MTNNYVLNKVIDCLNKVGVELESNINISEVILADYLLDSLSFVSFILMVEDEFNIEVPDALLMRNSELTLESLILISHRLGAIKYVDRIIVINNGAVAEDGNHEDLMQLRGLYYEMYTAQAKWYEL